MGNDTKDTKEATKASIGRLGNTLTTAFGRTIKVVVALSILAMVWRGLDLYQRQVMNDSVRVKIEVERHEMFKQHYLSENPKDAITKDEALEQIAHRASEKPTGPAPVVSVVAP